MSSISENRYLNFDLVLERAPSGSGAEANDDERQYRARVSSPMGEASTLFDLDIDPTDRRDFVKKIGHRGIDDGPVMRRLYSPGERAARELGGKLFDAVFASEVGRVYDRCREEIRGSSLPEGVRIRLRIDDQELAGLPWEFLHDGDREAFLTLSKLSPVVRVLDVKDVLRSQQVELPLRVLAMVSSPTGVPSLDVDAEYRRLESSMSERIAKGHIELTRIGGTLADLRRALRKDEFHVFHFIGHGAFDERHKDGVVVLEASDGGPEKVSGMMLGTTLRDETTIQLAVLNACEGGRASDVDPFSGVAQGLVRKGTPAVIAMQFEISDKAAIDLSHEFYGALCDGLSVDAALAEGRKAIYTPTDGVEWGTPVLFMQNDPQDNSGQIFRITDPPERQSKPEREPAPISAKPQESASTPPAPKPTPPAPKPAATVPPAPKPPETRGPEPAPPEPIATETKAAEPVAPGPIALQPQEPAKKRLPTLAIVGATLAAGVVGLGIFGATLDDTEQPAAEPVVLAATAEPTVPSTADAEDDPEPVQEDEKQVEPVQTSVQVFADDIVVPRIDQPPTIDGFTDEWLEIDYYGARSVVYRENWDGNIDAEAFFSFAHDDDNLYALVEIRDDVHDQINEGPNIFRGDAINLNIASARSADLDGPAPGDVQITLAVSDLVGATAHSWEGDGSFFSIPLGNRGFIEFHAQELGGGFVGEHYFVEIKIPKLALPADAGLILASINDSDGEHAQTVVLSHLLNDADFSSNVNPVFQSPNRWGRLTFE